MITEWISGWVRGDKGEKVVEEWVRVWVVNLDELANF
jgi:hypothetical protein